MVPGMCMCGGVYVCVYVYICVHVRGREEKEEEEKKEKGKLCFVAFGGAGGLRSHLKAFVHVEYSARKILGLSRIKWLSFEGVEKKFKMKICKGRQIWRSR